MNKYKQDKRENPMESLSIEGKNKKSRKNWLINATKANFAFIHECIKLWKTTSCNKLKRNLGNRSYRKWFQDKAKWNY